MKNCVVRTPASAANLGPGFDSLGIALGLYNEVEVEERAEGLSFGPCDLFPKNEENLFVRAYYLAIDKMGLPRKGLWISEHPAIPLSRGLGSSAAAIVAGVLAANALHENVLTRDEMLAIAAELERHPDNVAPALLGGLRASMMVGDKVVSAALPCENLHFTAVVPPFSVPTVKARALLPDTVPFKDAVFNLSRIALLARGFETGDIPLIRLAIQDRLHQSYRRPQIPGVDGVERIAEELGCAFCLSGAGPSVLLISDEEESAARCAERLTGALADWQALPLRRDVYGATVIMGDED